MNETVKIKKNVVYSDYNDHLFNIRRVRPGYVHWAWSINTDATYGGVGRMVRVGAINKITHSKEEFFDLIKKHYPEDVNLFLFHPEIFDGKYSDGKK